MCVKPMSNANMACHRGAQILRHHPPKAMNNQPGVWIVDFASVALLNAVRYNRSARSDAITNDLALSVVVFRPAAVHGVVRGSTIGSRLPHRRSLQHRAGAAPG